MSAHYHPVFSEPEGWMLKFFRHGWRDLSIAKKLYAIVGTMAVLIAMELFTLSFAMSTLSAVRAFVHGEGLWSKAQKDAVHNLLRYAADQDRGHYEEFRSNLKVILGDRKARLALQLAHPDREAARQGFLEGQIENKDIDGMIDLLLRFHNNSDLKNAIVAWTAADNKIDELIAAGAELHTRIRAPDFTSEKIKPVLAHIDRLNKELTHFENLFSRSLGEGSHWLEKILILILVTAVITVEGTGLVLTAFFSRGLLRDLRAIHDAALKVGQGDFNQILNVRSQDELGQLSGAVNKMIHDLRVSAANEKQAESASEAKTIFLANMSHEIRTPLGAILGFTELLRDPNLSHEDRNRYLDVVNRTGQNLTEIVNDVLDLSKIEAGHMDIEPRNFSLSLVLSDLYTLLVYRAAQKNLSLNFLYASNLPDVIYADPVRIRQILINVVGNAIKFTDHGRIDLICSSDSQQLHFRVRDTGIGISSRGKENLFRPFSQGEISVNRKQQGTGLGLILSRKLAVAMGGGVDLVETEPGQGSEFDIRISYQPAISLPAVSMAAEPGALVGKKILLVEDSVDNQMLLQLTLEKMGVQLEIAHNGKVGVEKALANHFDIVLMDMQMPIMDGYEATSTLRQKKYLVPIVALTAFAMKEDREKCLRAGCSDYVSKPIDVKTLVHVLAKHVASPRREAEPNLEL